MKFTVVSTLCYAGETSAASPQAFRPKNHPDIGTIQPHLRRPPKKSRCHPAPATPKYWVAVFRTLMGAVEDFVNVSGLLVGDLARSAFSHLEGIYLLFEFCDELYARSSEC